MFGGFSLAGLPCCPECGAVMSASDVDVTSFSDDFPSFIGGISHECDPDRIATKLLLGVGVEQEFGEWLETPAGRFAEFVADRERR
jgi:hypothetical protein